MRGVLPPLNILIHDVVLEKAQGLPRLLEATSGTV